MNIWESVRNANDYICKEYMTEKSKIFIKIKQTSIDNPLKN